MKPLSTLRRIQAVLALATVAGACATTSPAREGEDAPGVEIEVVNNTVPSYDRTVYLLDVNGSRRMLGRVMADSTATLRFVGPAWPDQVRLQARPVGHGTTVTSPPFTIGANGVRWSVRPNIVVSGG